MYMYVHALRCMYVCVYVRQRACMYVCMCTCVCVHMRVHVCVYMCQCARMHVYVCMQVFTLGLLGSGCKQGPFSVFYQFISLVSF